jgi:hypothetical protein
MIIISERKLGPGDRKAALCSWKLNLAFKKVASQYLPVWFTSFIFIGKFGA